MKPPGQMKWSAVQKVAPEAVPPTGKQSIKVKEESETSEAGLNITLRCLEVQHLKLQCPDYGRIPLLTRDDVVSEIWDIHERLRSVTDFM